MSPRAFFAFAVLSACTLRAAASVPLVNLVDDHTALVLSITDAPSLVRGWDASPLAKTWDEPQVVKFFAPLREKMMIEEWDEKTRRATGSTVRELLALADGEVLLAVPGMDLEALKKTVTPPFLLAIHVGDHAAKMEKILADAAAKAGVTDQTEAFAGATVHVRPLTASKGTDAKPDTFVWATVDGVWLASADKNRVFAAVDALKKGGIEAALGKSVRFLAARERAANDQALLYLNLSAIYPVVRDIMAALKTEPNRPNPMGVDPDAVFGALGLDALNDAFCGVNLGTPDARLDFGLTYAEERGVLKLIALEPGPSPRPDWIPATWPSVATIKFDAPQAYAGLEQLVNGISPLLSALAQGEITETNRKLGIDLKRDLVGSLGDEIVNAYAPPPGLESGTPQPRDQMDRLIAISLKNTETFTRAVEGLKQMAGGPAAADKRFSKRDYLGQTIYTFNARVRLGASPVRGFSYAIANNTLLIGVGSSSMVEGALEGMRDGRNLFWKWDDIKAALAGMPPEASGTQFTDLRAGVPAFFERVAGWGGAASWVDLAAKPDGDALGSGLGMASGWTFKTDNGLFYSIRIAYPKP